MALQMTLTVKLTDGTTVTKTAPGIFGQAPFNNGHDCAVWLTKGGGFTDDAGAWHPASAVVTITFA